jgi:hypothetical protein
MVALSFWFSKKRIFSLYIFPVSHRWIMHFNWPPLGDNKRTPHLSGKMLIGLGSSMSEAQWLGRTSGIARILLDSNKVLHFRWSIYRTTNVQGVGDCVLPDSSGLRWSQQPPSELKSLAPSAQGYLAQQKCDFLLNTRLELSIKPLGGPKVTELYE